MKHFSTMEDAGLRSVFAVQPREFCRDSPRDTLAMSLGATLYTKATRVGLGNAIRRQGLAGATSMVICMEDSIRSVDVDLAHRNLASALDTPVLRDAAPDIPTLFARVRHPDEIARICGSDPHGLVNGFVVPKFAPETAAAWFQAARSAGDLRGRQLWVMPVLESSALTDPVRRPSWIGRVRETLATHRELVLTVRIGAADILGSLGLRRSRGATSYDVTPLRDAISAVVGAFLADDVVPAVSGCVWDEYPAPSDVVHRASDQLLNTAESDVLSGWGDILAELDMDHAHGLVGKTVIHPRQVPVVNAWHAVTYEDYIDAEAVLSSEGATASPHGNRMNEALPHGRWARKVLQLSALYGVLAPGVTRYDLATTLVAEHFAGPGERAPMLQARGGFGDA